MEMVRGGVVVVGAGPTGLALAIEMVRGGVPVRIIDKGSEPVQWSQALVVQARTLEQFERYGLAEKAVEQGHPIRHAAMFHGRHRFLHFDFARIKSRYPFALFLPQAKPRRCCSHICAASGLKWSAKLSFWRSRTALMAERRQSGVGTAPETIPFRWLVGCDGAHSTVRHALGIPFEGEGVGLRFFLGDLELTRRRRARR